MIFFYLKKLNWVCLNSNHSKIIKINIKTSLSLQETVHQSESIQRITKGGKYGCCSSLGWADTPYAERLQRSGFNSVPDCFMCHSHLLFPYLGKVAPGRTPRSGGVSPHSRVVCCTRQCKIVGFFMFCSCIRNCLDIIFKRFLQTVKLR